MTGITAEMVAGQAIDMAVVSGSLLEPAELVIAHNAKFDRAFCERLDDGFPPQGLGLFGRRGALAQGSASRAPSSAIWSTVAAWFHYGHRAVDDCHALLEVLAYEVGGASSFSHLLQSSGRTRVRVWAEWAPFDMKDVLKARGYRWSGGGDGRPKAWWTEVDEDDLAVELRFLEREVYLREVELRRDVLTAYERYRTT